MLIPEELFELASKIADDGSFFPCFEIGFDPSPIVEIYITDGNDFDEVHSGLDGAKEFLERFLE